MKQIIIDCRTGQQTVVEVPDVEVAQPTSEELRAQYESLVVDFIRAKYSDSEETAIHRKKLAGLDTEGEFEVYNTFVEDCKTRAKLQVYGGVV